MSETEQKPIEEPEGTPGPSEAPETPAEEQPTEREREEERSRGQRRIGYLTARATQAEAKAAQAEQRLAALEAQMRGHVQAQQVDPAYQQMVQAEAQRIAIDQQNKATFARFDAAGTAAYPDWTQRCNELAAWGAVPIAQAMAEMENGHRVAAALHDAPEELERIMALPTDGARRLALGQFAGKLAAQPTRNISRAPAPPKPIHGRVAPEYNPYQETDASKLAQIWAEADMQKRMRR